MSLIETARNALKELPMSDIVRERLSLALDRLAGSEAKIDALQSENGRLQAKLEIKTLDCDKAQRELRSLQEEHTEEVRIHRAIEFRRGKRTDGKWTAFCPKCHLPAVLPPGRTVMECSANCGWLAPMKGNRVERFISEL